MSISYRILYESVHGPIPKDEQGRTYHIHHRDGNHANNDINNLQCVSIQEHYDIHYFQGDWQACVLLSAILDITREERVEMARKSANERVSAGTHNWQNSEIARERQIQRVKDGIHAFLGGEMQRERQIQRVKDGTHHMLDGKISREIQARRVKDGTHNLLGKSNPVHEQLKNGTHNFQRRVDCEFCNQNISLSNYSRHLKAKHSNENVSSEKEVKN